MAKREISSTLKNLKFMQRATIKEEKTKKGEEEVVIADGNFPSSSKPRKCVVIMEGDPHPGVLRGRMSFQSFNPSVDKLNEEAGNISQPDSSTTSSGDQGGGSSSRENGSARGDVEMERHHSDASEDLKRKQAEVISEVPNPSKTQKNSHGHQESPSSSRITHKKQKREKLDWNVLRPPKPQNRRG